MTVCLIAEKHRTPRCTVQCAACLSHERSLTHVACEEDCGMLWLRVGTPDQEVRRKKLDAEIHELEQRLKTPTPELAREQTEWERSVKEAREGWSTVVPLAMKTVGGATLTQKPDGAVLA